MKKLLILLTIFIAGAVLYNATQTDPEDNFPSAVANEQPTNTAINDTCPDEAPMVTITTSQDTTSHAVLLDGVMVDTITDTWLESEAHIFRQTKCNAWIVASATGRGGYILYGGDDQLYRLNFVAKTLTRVNFDGFLTDISSDERTVVSVSSVDGTDGTKPSIEVTDVETGMHVQYVVQDPYNDAGSAKFSPDVSVIAYAVVERDTETNDPIANAIFVIDLDTGLQQMMPRTDLALDQALYITGWIDSNTPIVSITP